MRLATPTCVAVTTKLGAHCCTRCAVNRTFAEFLGHTTSLQYLERIGPTYVALIIAAFHAIVRAGPCKGPAFEWDGIDPEVEEMAQIRFVAAAVLPLTEMLAACDAFEAVPLLDWMLAGGASIAQ